MPGSAPEIDYRAELPHRQIAAWLLERIDSGELAIGQPMPLGSRAVLL
jgi:DNA-binding GntR family transcriptional regulator